MSRYITSYHSIPESIKAGDGVLYLSKSNKRIAEIERNAKAKGIPVNRITAAEMDRKCGSGDHKGALFMPEKRTVSEGGAAQRFKDLKSFLRDKGDAPNLLVLLLDGITDPHNLGAIIRSADQFGVDLIMLPEKRSASVNATVAKVSVGAHAWVPVLNIGNAARAIEELQDGGFWVYGADMGGASAADTDLKGKTCIVMGSEGKGISRLLKDKCDTMVSIPMSGHVDSLNVSVAAGILMYEVQRQRG